MTDQRNITREDIWLKARILSEGVRVETDPSTHVTAPWLPGIILDGCELPVMVPYNKYSRLEILHAGGTATICDHGEVIGTGTSRARARASDQPHSEAPTGHDKALSALTGGSDLLSISIHYRCYNHDSGNACKYCEKIIGNAQVPSGNELTEAIASSSTTAAGVIRTGWRGCLMMTGGVLPPSRRNRLIDRLETAMTNLHEALPEDVISSLQITVNAYPPDDLAELEQWKALGINSTSFDLEVMDPAFWRAICPGKAETTTHEHWIAASEAAAEIFGRGRGAMSAVVLGIEPMKSFLDGFEDLVARGIYPTPYFFLPPNKKLGFHGFRPPTADWLVEVNDEMADVLFHAADTFDVNLLTDDRPGLTRVGRSYNQILLCDEMTRRLQELGTIPPGLPRHDVYEPREISPPANQPAS